MQANDQNKEKLLGKSERPMIRTRPEEVTQSDFANQIQDKKMEKENRIDNLREPPELHRKDKSVNYNRDLKQTDAAVERRRSHSNLHYLSFSGPNVCLARLQMELCLAENIFAVR